MLQGSGRNKRRKNKTKQNKKRMLKTRSNSVSEEIKPTISVIGTSLIEKGSYVVPIHQEYHILIKYDKENQFRTSKRFRDLSKLHNKLSDAMSVELPRFPSKKIGAGAHLVDMSLVADRVTELQTYFSELLKKNPQVLRLNILYDELGMTEAAKKDGKIAFLMKTLEQYGRKFPDEKKKSREWGLFTKTQQVTVKEPQSITKSPNETITKKTVTPMMQTQEQINDYLYAQRFHMIAKSGTGIPGLYYKHNISFEVSEDAWLKGDRTIREELFKRVWFSFAGPIPAATAGWEHSHGDICYAIVNAAASVPLLYLVVPKREKRETIGIYEAITDGKIGSIICTVKKEEIIKINVGNRTCTCSGEWRGEKNMFELRQSVDEDGAPSALIKWVTGHDNKKLINISIKAHRDILFYMGVVIGINFFERKTEARGGEQ